MQSLSQQLLSQPMPSPRLTIRGEGGDDLTDVTGHRGATAHQLIVDSVVQPGALLAYYFDHAGGNVILVRDNQSYAATLHTRWSMGRRGWWLSHDEVFAGVVEPHAVEVPASHVRATSRRASRAAANVKDAVDATGA